MLESLDQQDWSPAHGVMESGQGKEKRERSRGEGTKRGVTEG